MRNHIAHVEKIADALDVEAAEKPLSSSKKAFPGAVRQKGTLGLGQHKEVALHARDDDATLHETKEVLVHWGTMAWL
jgi:hypothetical protein